MSHYLQVHFMSIKYTCDSKSQTLRMHYLFQSTGRPISHRNGWLFCVYMIPLQDFVQEWNSCPGTRTSGVKSHWADLHRHGILWRCHVNKVNIEPGSCKHPLTDGSIFINASEIKMLKHVEHEHGGHIGLRKVHPRNYFSLFYFFLNFAGW